MYSSCVGRATFMFRCFILLSSFSSDDKPLDHNTAAIADQRTYGDCVVGSRSDYLCTLGSLMSYETDGFLADEGVQFADHHGDAGAEVPSWTVNSDSGAAIKAEEVELGGKVWQQTNHNGAAAGVWVSVDSDWLL